MSMLVTLLPGPDPRVVGGSARERNVRVAMRAGATLIDVDALSAHGGETAIAVPADVLIDMALFALPMPSTATWLDAAPGVGVLAGPADALAATIPALQGRGGLPSVPIPADAAMDVSRPRACRRATWRILERTAKPTDGWVSRHWNRPISRRISFVALQLGLKASHASIATLAIGLATALFALRPGYITLVLTGVLFQLSSVLDGVDGEIARSTLTESDAGAQLDLIVDQITYIACFIGLTIGWAREGGGLQALVLTVLILVALVTSLIRAARFVRKYAPDASFVFIDRSVRRAARDSGTLALRLIAGGFAFLRRDLFAIVFLVVSFAGRRALIPGMIAVGILFANFTFSVYRRELAAAAVAERA